MNESVQGAAGGGADVRNDGIDPLLAVQLSDRPRYDVWPGEMRLALAVVEDAIITVRTTAGMRSARAHRLATEAWRWLASRDTRHPYAFENLCDYLGLSAAWLRNGLRLAGCAAVTPPGAGTPERGCDERGRRRARRARG
jgi:hypothetical protein